MTTTKHPIQPIITDDKGVLRFKENRIVRDLLDFATDRGFGLNEIALRDYSREDRQQLAQLIGYSLHGYGELRSYVDDDAYGAAQFMASGLSEVEARTEHLQSTLNSLRAALVKPEVVAYSWQCHGRHSTVDKKFADELVADGERVDPLIRLSDYETLQADYEKMQSEMATVKKVAYGNVELLGQVEALQAECEALRKDAEQ